MSEQFTFFWNGPFSQWYPSTFAIDGQQYNCAEQFMMAEKARYFVDDVALSKIMKADHPRDQKRFGREVSSFVQSEWEHIEGNGRPYCWNVVHKGNMAKFEQNDELRAKLLATAGTTLVEASPVDGVWGIGLAAEDSRAKDRDQWLGTNWLGEVLTDVRDRLSQ